MPKGVAYSTEETKFLLDAYFQSNRPSLSDIAHSLNSTFHAGQSVRTKHGCSVRIGELRNSLYDVMRHVLHDPDPSSAYQAYAEERNITVRKYNKMFPLREYIDCFGETSYRNDAPAQTLSTVNPNEGRADVLDEPERLLNQREEEPVSP